MIALAPADKCSRVRCQEPRAAGKDLCVEHQAKQSAANKRRYEYRRARQQAAGLCVNCSRPVFRGVLCQKCWEYQRSYQSTRESRLKRARRYEEQRSPEAVRREPYRASVLRERPLTPDEARALENCLLAKPAADRYAPPTKIEPEFEDEEHELRYLELLEFKRKGLSIGGREPAQLGRPTHTEKGYA